MRLEDGTWTLLQEALHLYGDDPHASFRLHEQVHRLSEPLRIAIQGPARSGKSTLVNAILGEEVAPVFGDGNHFITWYEDGPQPQITAYSAQGVARELPVTRSAGGMRVNVGGWFAEQVRDLVVRWPTRALRHVRLADIPSDSACDPAAAEADAVLYLSRDARPADLEAMQASQVGTVARAAPVNSLLVLSRADELGGGRIDALLSARQLARRQQRDPRIGSACLGVVAVSGLVALAGRVLSEADFAALADLARTPRSELDRSLLSADRFVTGDPAGRGPLLTRFGLHGVRLATTLIRGGHDTRAKLAAELARRSGLSELRECLHHYFIDRREVLKARSALVALEVMVRADPRPEARDLLMRLERVVAGAHEFAELGLLAALRSPQLGFDVEAAAEAHRLIGGNGPSLAARLGLEEEITDAQLWALASEALIRWQALAGEASGPLAHRRAAQVVVRSCEGLLAELSESRRFGYAG